MASGQVGAARWAGQKGKGMGAWERRKTKRGLAAVSKNGKEHGHGACARHMRTDKDTDACAWHDKVRTAEKCEGRASRATRHHSIAASQHGDIVRTQHLSAAAAWQAAR